MPKCRVVHVAPDWHGAACLDRAFPDAAPALHLGGDDLLVGPVAPLVGLARWRRDRNAFWRTIDSRGFRRPTGVKLTQIDSNGGRLRDADEIVFWAGTTPSEQLALAWGAQALRLLGADPGRLRIVASPIPDGRVPAPEIGLARPEALVRSYSGHPACSPGALALLDDAWRALIAPEPDEMVAVARRESLSLPLLPRAFERLLERFPDSTSGLNWLDQELLGHVHANGPRVARIIGHALGDAFDAGDLVGDLVFLARLRRLSAPTAQAPALTLSGEQREMRGANAHLTALGHDVLAGQANFLDRNALDDWVGGVHLDSSAARVWVRSEHGLQRWP